MDIFSYTITIGAIRPSLRVEFDKKGPYKYLVVSCGYDDSSNWNQHLLRMLFHPSVHSTYMYIS